MAGQERVDVRQRCCHAARERFEGLSRFARVHPDDVMRQPRKPLHRLREMLRSIAFPPIAHDHQHRTASHAASAELVDEGSDRMADTGTTGPIVGRLGRLPVRDLGIGGGQLPSEPRQVGCEDECFRLDCLNGTAHQMQIYACIWLHRPGDVRDQDDAARFGSALAIHQAHRVTGRSM